jgi:hypothetical protein
MFERRVFRAREKRGKEKIPKCIRVSIQLGFK